MQAKAAQKEIEEFTLDFKNAARKCFELIDKDGGGTLDKGEIVRAVKEDQEVISFLKTCGEENLMFLLHPPRLEKALAVLDTDNSGEVDVDEWETAINRGLAKRLEQMAKERERRERAAAAADEEFSAEFLTAARKVFQMIDDDDSGTLEKAEIVTAVRANKVAKAASYNLQSVICGTAVFVCLVCGGAGLDYSSNYEHTHTQRNNRTTALHFAPFAESHQVPQDVRRGEPAIPIAPAAAAEGLGDPGHG